MKVRGLRCRLGWHVWKWQSNGDEWRSCRFCPKRQHIERRF